MSPDLHWTFCVIIVFVLLPKDIRETILGDLGDVYNSRGKG